MLNAFWTLFKGIIALLKYPFYFIAIVITIFIFMCSIFIVIRLAQRKKV